MSLTIIPHVVNNQTIYSLRDSKTAHDAVELMIEHDVSAIVVVNDDDKISGIVTERDIIRKIVAQGLDAKGVSLKDIMTQDPVTVAPGSHALEALERMRRGGFRHLPVVTGGKVVGMVSMRDIRQTVSHHSINLRPNPVTRTWRRLIRHIA